MTAARKASRASMGILDLWTTDKGTLPVLFCAGVAAVGALVTTAHTLAKSPDICLSKERRESNMHHQEDEGSDWRARRLRFAYTVSNPINRSRQFEGLEKKK